MAVIKTSHYKDLPPQQCSAVCKLFPALTASGQSIACAVCIREVSVHPHQAPRAPWQCRGATEGPGGAPAPLGMEGQQGCRDGDRLPVHVLVCVHTQISPPRPGLTHVSWERGSEHGSKLSTMHSPTAQARSSQWGRASASLRSAWPRDLLIVCWELGNSFLRLP